MNKNIKRIIALALAFGTISAVAPAASSNLFLTKAYAADENDDTTLDELKLETSGGSNIKLYDDSSYDTKVDSEDVSDDGEYYAKTSSKTIKVNPEGVSSKYVKVFKGTSKSTKGKSASNDISLSSGKNTIVVRVYKNKPDTDIKYSEDDDVASEYKLYVKYTGSDSGSSSDDSDSYDDIYLKKLTVDGQSISLSESKTVYDYSVANNVSSVSIKAEPDDEDADNDYDVSIDGSDVDSGDSFKKTVNLKTGINEIKIKLEYTDDDDDDSERVYTLKINRAAPVQEAVVVKKTDQWVQVNGRWQYNDTMGNPMKNTWFFDRGYQKWYFLGVDGYMQTGWILNGGKYYYLYADGSMASNTTINGYKLGPNGDWIK